ncbi:MAG: sensor histidine kinase [Christensenellales bacterium]
MRKFLQSKIRSHIKLFVLFIVTLIIPLTIITLISQYMLSAQMEEKLVDADKRGISQLMTSLNLELNKIGSIGHLVNANASLSQCIAEYQKGNLDYEKANTWIKNIVNEYSVVQYSMNSMYPSIAVMTFDGSIFGNILNREIFKTEEFKEAIADFSDSYNQYEVTWITDTQLFHIENPAHDNNIYLLHSLWDSFTLKRIGVIVLQMRQSSLLKQYMGAVASQQSIFIVSPDGQVISQMDNLKLDYNPKDVFNYQLEGNDTFIKKLNGERYLVSVYQIPTTRWRILSVSEMDALLVGFSQISSTYIIAIVACIILSLFLAYSFSSYFIRPVKRLNLQMRHVMQGNLKARVTVSSSDEIGELSLQFNQMVEQLQTLMQRVVEEQEAKRKSDIFFLQSQINPHILYNTLASLRYMIVTGDKENAETIVLALNRIMKCMLSDTQQLITINMEAAQLNDYLTIAKFGFVTPLETSVDIDPEIGDCKTMKLLLQPIVENAVLHGLKAKQDHPVLSVKAYQSGDDIEFAVQDNGSGFDVAELNNKKKSKKESMHIGIDNVDRRIKLYFGEKYGLKIESEIGKGTTVYIRIPKILEKEEFTLNEYIDR